MKIKNLFTEDVQKILTEDSLNAIQEAFDAKVELNVETALQQQDDLYAEKLQTLITTIDKDHTAKMKRLVEAVDSNNASKLVKIVKLYERDSKRDAKKFKKQIVESVSAYLEEYLNEAVNAKDIAQAVKNKTAFNVLENLRNVLAVDSVMMKESVKDAVLDGKAQIDKLTQERNELASQFKALYEANQKTEVNMLLESKTSKLPEAKKNFIRKALEGKSAKFINENFDYTLRLFEKQEKEKLVTLKEQAINNRAVKPDVVPQQKIVEEKVNNNNDTHGDMYVDVLSKSWASKPKN
jgi:hypothetical protein